MYLMSRSNDRSFLTNHSLPGLKLAMVPCGKISLYFRLRAWIKIQIFLSL